MAKATKKEMYQREMDTLGLIGEGKSRTEIVEICSKSWGVAERTAQDFYYRVLNNVYSAENLEETRNETKSVVMTQLTELYKMAIKTGNIAQAANIVKLKMQAIENFYKAGETKTETKKIVISERDSAPLKIVGDKAENE